MNGQAPGSPLAGLPLSVVSVFYGAHCLLPLHSLCSAPLLPQAGAWASPASAERTALPWAAYVPWTRRTPSP